VKYNHNHDPRNGQFTYGPGGGADATAASPFRHVNSFSFTTGPLERPAPKQSRVVVRTNPKSGSRTFSDGHVEVTLEPPKPSAAVDERMIGGRTVHEVSNILTNETNGLSGGAPGELARAKTAVTHAIHNGLLLRRPPQVAPYQLSSQAAASIGRAQDEEISRRVYIERSTAQTDAVGGAAYYGTSPSLITSRRIGNGRQDVLQRFGPFDHGSGPFQYVYIYGAPYVPKKK
jgi:hypothetical protein